MTRSELGGRGSSRLLLSRNRTSVRRWVRPQRRIYEWPHGTVWHLLPDEILTRSLDRGATIVTLPDELAKDSGFPTAHARPRFALTLRRSGRVQRAVLVGNYSDGASLDRDAIRSVQGIFDDALVV